MKPADCSCLHYTAVSVLYEDYTRDLIGWFRTHNRQNFALLGLQDAAPGRFETIQEKRKDPEVALTVITGALEAGMAVKEEEAYSRLTLTPPKEGDRIIEPKAPEPQFPGMGGGGFPFRETLKDVVRECLSERLGDRWVTIGAQSGDNGERTGGRPVLIDDEGRIKKGPKGSPSSTRNSWSPSASA